jgi:hypothetical protein
VLNGTAKAELLSTPRHHSPSWPRGKAHPAAATGAGGAAPQVAGGAAAEDSPTSVELEATKGDMEDGIAKSTS